MTGKRQERGNQTRSRILAFIRRYWSDNLCPPSYRNMMNGCHISSTSVMRYHLDKLITDGRIIRGERGVRPANMHIVFYEEGMYKLPVDTTETGVWRTGIDDGK